MNEEIEIPNKQINISEINGRTVIVSKKAVLKGKITSKEVLERILVAAGMQAEKYIEKLSRGAPLEPHEVKCLKELAEIAKIDVAEPPKPTVFVETASFKSLTSELYQGLIKKID